MEIIIINKLFNSFKQLKVDKELCIKEVSPLCTCSSCIDSCPRECIYFKDGKLQFNDDCTQCGICSSVCKTRAISIKEPTEEKLYDALKLNYGRMVTCTRNESCEESSKNCVKINCLGALSIEFIFLAKIQGFFELIEINESLCKSCQFQSGVTLFKERAIICDEYIKSFLEDKSIGYLNNIKNNKRNENNLNECGYKNIKDDEGVIDIGRREFLSSIIKVIKSLPNDFVKEKLNVKDNSVDSFSDKHFIYHKLLTDFLIEVSNEDLGFNELTFIEMPSFDGSCSLCRACEKLCPSNALKFERDRIILNIHNCSGCGLCKDICYRKAIELRKIKYSDLRTKTFEFPITERGV